MIEHYFPQPLLQQPWVMRLGWTLIHFIWQGTAIAVLTAMALSLAGRRVSARGRYAVLCGGLCLMIVAPWITCAVLATAPAEQLAPPGWRLPSAGCGWSGHGSRVWCCFRRG
jgi:hypothetical protein